MKAPSLFRSAIRSSRTISGSRNGVALLVVLAFIVLLSILVASYLSFTGLDRLSTASYSKSIQAQEIAQGGLQDIIADLHQEIVAGSYVLTSGTSTNIIYLPLSSLAAVPNRLGYSSSSLWGNGPTATTTPTGAPTTLLPSLVRVSRASQDTGNPTYFDPPISTSVYANLSSASNPTGAVLINRASPASSGTLSVNGHYISPARWNKPLLLGSNTASIPAPFCGTESIPTLDPVSNSGNGTAPYQSNALSDLPDWVYVTRSGSRACTSSELISLMPSNNLSTSYNSLTSDGRPQASPVVGRYAYVVYDEGALLDANTSGYNSSSLAPASNPQPTYTDPITGNIQNQRGKSFLASADLTQLPGLAGAQTSIIDKFLAWRNAGGIDSYSTASVPFLGAVFNYSKTGFLDFLSSTNKVNDSPILSRQDLINYFTKIDPNIDTTSATYSSALPFLGTFFHANNAPSWHPLADASTLGGNNGPTTANSIYAYKTNSENLTSINRDLANTRFVNSGNVTHYNDDQSTAQYSVLAGDPLLQTRFSLARIGWLSQADPVRGSGPTGNYPAAIKSCFGLQWGNYGSANGGNACWSYIGSGNAAFSGTIETLGDVAKEIPPREPNFFELLKGVILSGSLGQDPGKCIFDNGTDPTTQYDLHNSSYSKVGADGRYAYSFDQAGKEPAPCRIPDMQIMQIGANIIDQYDADSYPTAIYFKFKGTLPDAITTYDASNDDAASDGQSFGAEDMVFGDENLPQLMGFTIPAATVDGKPAYSSASPKGSYGTTEGLSMWWQPLIWNCHQMPATGQATGLPPAFEIQGYGNLSMEWGANDLTAPVKSGTSQPPQKLDGNQTIDFADSAPTTSIFYNQPALLVKSPDSDPSVQPPALPNVTVSVSNSNMAATSSIEGWTGKIAGSSYTCSPNHFVGFWAGNDATYQGSKGFVNVTSTATGTTDNFCLGWTTDSPTSGKSATNFHPYSFMPGIFGYIYGVVNNANGTPAGYTDPLGISAAFHLVIDPRTQRFSSMCNWTSGWPFSSVGTTLFPDNTTGHHFGVGGLWALAQGALPLNSTFTYASVSDGFNEEDWQVNSKTPSFKTAADATYYTDPDGIVRPGDGVYGNNLDGNGVPSFTSNGSSTSSLAAGDSGNTQEGRRPIILNRPFRSVGELGYVFRDLPFKTLDFFTPSSADVGLLDVFSVVDQPRVIAGQINLSNASYPVIASLLSLGCKKELDPDGSSYNDIIPIDIPKIVTGLQNQLNPGAGKGGTPLLSRADIVARLSPFLTQTTVPKFNPTYKADLENKAYFEAPMRAVSNVANTRTWNLMIDVIAQSGHLTPNPKNLDSFVVEGERRYWLHIAIDRYTGSILSQQLEPVYE